ncbi:MAG: hypothetical protein ACLU4N_06230 [Butyricimonas faecihominis]
MKQVVKDSTLLSFYDPDWYAVLPENQDKGKGRMREFDIKSSTRGTGR